MKDLALTYKKRNQTADLLKGIAVIFMIQVHLMELFARQDLFDSVTGKVSLFLGGPSCAPVFLVVMGFFLALSEKKQCSYYLKRGALLFFCGIGLNIVRTTNLFFYIGSGQSKADPLFYIFGVDILLLAGLSIILVGLIRFLLDKHFLVSFLLAFAIAAVSSYLPVSSGAATPADYVLAFLWGAGEWSYFPLFPWLAYVLIGYGFSLFCARGTLKKIPKTAISLLILIPALVFCSVTFSYAFDITHDLNGKDGYYHHGFLFFIWTLVFLSGYFVFVNLLEKMVGKTGLARLIKWIGKNVTVVYVIQWILIGNIGTAVYKTQNLMKLVCWFAGITVLTLLLTLLWEKLVRMHHDRTDQKAAT